MKVFTCTESTRTLFLSQISGIIYIIILTLIACAFFLIPHQIAIAQTVHIPDPNLRAALGSALGKEVGADISQAEMESLESLDAFEAGIRDLTGLEFAVNLAAVYLGLNEIGDVSPLKNLTKLTVLDLHRNGKILDVSPLKGLTNLTWLSLRGNRISDVSPLKGLTNLTYLHVAYNSISDVSALETLTSLTFLDVEANRKISDLSSFSVLTNLTYLDFDNVGISDLTPLQTLTKLEELDASDNQISNISVLKNLTKLRNLDLDDNQISNISSLSTLTEMIWLDLDDNQILDASPLKGLTNLKWLDLDHSRISDMSPLKDLIDLTYLDLNDNQISDVSPLKDLTKLIVLDLDGNHISDVSPLKDLINLTELDLHGNHISDVSPLKDMTKLIVLDLDDNHISNIAPLKNMINLTELDLDGNEISDVSPLKDLVNLTVLDLHDNHILDFSPIAGLIENLIAYNASNQTVPTPKAADVNRDGVVNIKDLVVIASNFHEPDLAVLAQLNTYPDVNRDGVVNLIDLLLVAVEMGSDAAAPALSKGSVETSNLTVENLSQWIRLAKQLDTHDPQMQKGITVLEQLLAALSVAEMLPKETALLANYPNPFNPETWIPYQLSEPADVRISIHSADGKLIRVLELGQLSAGRYYSKSRAVYWDGRNELGESVASGIYFYTLTTDDFTATGKMLIQK